MLNEQTELAHIFKVPVFSAALTVAIKEFQKRVGLPQTGKPSPKMWQILAKGKENKVIAVNQSSSVEDFDDDAKQAEPETMAESLPTCSSILELYVLFENTDWELVKRNKKGLKESYSHCTATRQDASFKALQNGWRARGWKSDGYNICVAANGDWILFMPFHLTSNGVAGRNSFSIHKSYIGGIDSNGRAIDNRTPEQILFDKHWHYLISVYCPWVKERGHNEVSNKACPSYNVQEWLLKNRLKE